MKTLELSDPLPNSVRNVWRAAAQHGWNVWTTEATGTPVDLNGEPLHKTQRVPLFDDNTGAPLMTDGDKPKQRVEVVKLDDLQVVDSIVVRLRHGQIRLALSWESTDGGATWAFRSCLRQSPFCRLNSREALALIELTRDVAQ